jgi:hypothetical protein
MTLLTIIAATQLALFAFVCGAILRELRRARHEAAERGHGMLGELRNQQEIELVLEDELRQIRKRARETVGVRGDGA